MTSILVVEDEAHIRDEVMDWLTFEGYEVIGAENGREALNILGQSEPDLIISDIRMPEMDGYELLLEIRSDPHWLHIPFIFLTASAERDSVRRGMDTGADDYLTKPFTHAEVLHAVHARLEKKTALDAKVRNQMQMLNSALGEEREKRLLKSRLVAMFSHDFRNPLASIMSSAGILRDYHDRLTAERRVQHLDRIDSAVHLLLQMLDDMLMVAELEGGQIEIMPQMINLETFVGDIVNDFCLIDQNQHTIHYRPSVSEAVMADPKLVRQIVSNLLSNAIKYSPAQTEITVQLYQENGSISLEIQDQGIGIPQDDVAHLFEPFYRAANARDLKGTGLGLAIVQECVDQHGGTITVQSAQGQGTRFVVRLSEFEATDK